MFGNIMQFFKKFKKSEKEESKSTAKERLHLVLAQDRANISADFLEMMKQEILEVIKKYIDIDEKAIDVRLTNKEGEDGSVGAPALYANIPIITIKNDARKLEGAIKKNEEPKKANVEYDNVKNNNTETVEAGNTNENGQDDIEEKEVKENVNVGKHSLENKGDNKKEQKHQESTQKEKADIVTSIENTENVDVKEEDNEKKNA